MKSLKLQISEKNSIEFLKYDNFVSIVEKFQYKEQNQENENIRIKNICLNDIAEINYKHEKVTSINERNPTLTGVFIAFVILSIIGVAVTLYLSSFVLSTIFAVSAVIFLGLACAPHKTTEDKKFTFSISNNKEKIIYSNSLNMIEETVTRIIELIRENE